MRLDLQDVEDAAVRAIVDAVLEVRPDADVDVTDIRIRLEPALENLAERAENIGRSLVHYAPSRREEAAIRY